MNGLESEHRARLKEQGKEAEPVRKAGIFPITKLRERIEWDRHSTHTDRKNQTMRGLAERIIPPSYVRPIDEWFLTLNDPYARIIVNPRRHALQNQYDTTFNLAHEDLYEDKLWAYLIQESYATRKDNLRTTRFKLLLSHPFSYDQLELRGLGVSRNTTHKVPIFFEIPRIFGFDKPLARIGNGIYTVDDYIDFNRVAQVHVPSIDGKPAHILPGGLHKSVQEATFYRIASARLDQALGMPKPLASSTNRFVAYAITNDTAGSAAVSDFRAIRTAILPDSGCTAGLNDILVGAHFAALVGGPITEHPGTIESVRLGAEGAIRTGACRTFVFTIALVGTDIQSGKPLVLLMKLKGSVHDWIPRHDSIVLGFRPMLETEWGFAEKGSYLANLGHPDFKKENKWAGGNPMVLVQYSGKDEMNPDYGTIDPSTAIIEPLPVDPDVPDYRIDLSAGFGSLSA